MPVNRGARIKLAVDLRITNLLGDNYTIGGKIGADKAFTRVSVPGCEPEYMFVY